MKVAITHWPRLTEPQGKRVQTTWSALLERLRTPRVASVKLEIPGFALATFAGDRRALANVEQVYAIGLDFDNHADLGVLRIALAKTASFLHTTWQSTPAAPRARAFILLSRPVTAAEYRILYRHAAKLMSDEGHEVDRQASDPSRLWFLPATQPAATLEHFTGDGLPMSVPDVVVDPDPPAMANPNQIQRPSAPIGGAQYERARAYLARVPGAISGSGGHGATFLVAQRMVNGFGLQPGEAFALLCDWNLTCQPPWAEHELRRKVEQAVSVGRMGAMPERSR